MNTGSDKMSSTAGLRSEDIDAAKIVFTSSSDSDMRYLSRSGYEYSIGRTVQRIGEWLADYLTLICVEICDLSSLTKSRWRRLPCCFSTRSLGGSTSGLMA